MTTLTADSGCRWDASTKTCGLQTPTLNGAPQGACNVENAKKVGLFEFGQFCQTNNECECLHWSGLQLSCENGTWSGG